MFNVLIICMVGTISERNLAFLLAQAAAILNIYILRITTIFASPHFIFDLNTTQKKMAVSKTNGFLAVSSHIFLPLTICRWRFPLFYMIFSIKSSLKIEILF